MFFDEIRFKPKRNFKARSRNVNLGRHKTSIIFKNDLLKYLKLSYSNNYYNKILVFVYTIKIITTHIFHSKSKKILILGSPNKTIVLPFRRFVDNCRINISC